MGSGLLADRFGESGSERAPSARAGHAHAYISVGPLNVLIPATLMVALVTFTWPFAQNVASFVAIAVFLGCVSLFTPILAPVKGLT